MDDGFNALLVAASYLENRKNDNENTARGGLLLFLFDFNNSHYFLVYTMYISNIH